MTSYSGNEIKAFIALPSDISKISERNTRMTLTHEKLNLILSQIASYGTTMADVVIMAMLPTDVENLFDKLHGHKQLHEKVSAWVHTTMKTMYTAEILSLTQPDAQLHCIAKGMTENKLCEFNIDNIIKQMSVNTPLVWELLDELLSADPDLRYQRSWARKRAQETAAAKRRPPQGTSSNSHNDINDDEQYWEFFDESVPIVEEDEDELQAEDIVDRVERRHESKIVMVSR